MPAWEICEKYRTAKEPEKMIGILADLNGAMPKDIREVLIRNGLLEKKERKPAGRHGRNEELSRTIGGNIKRLCDERQISALCLSKQIGIPHSAIYYLIGGYRSPSADTLVAIADALDVSIDELVGRSK
jgi:DNA-binding Xre family transcriptional regulator